MMRAERLLRGGGREKGYGRKTRLTSAFLVLLFLYFKKFLVPCVMWVCVRGDPPNPLPRTLLLGKTVCPMNVVDRENCVGGP
jgi:hypothetical protein